MLQYTPSREAVARQLENEVAQVTPAEKTDNRKIKKETKNLFFYFHHLNKRDPYQFEKKWNQIPTVDYTARDFSQTLYKTAIHLHDPAINDEARGEILSTIRRDIDTWLSPALGKIKLFNNQTFTNSLWALAVIDSHYSDDCLTDAYNAIRKNINVQQFKDVRDLQQIRDADLWFTGKSDILIPKKIDDFIPSLHFEKTLSAAFNKAGYDIETPSEAPISELKQAVDFILVDPNSGTKIWVEIDGPTHFNKASLSRAKTASDLEYNAQTYFRRALQRRLAPSESKILSVDFITSKNIKTLSLSNYPVDKLEFIILCDNLFNATAKEKSGVYRTVDNPEVIKPMNRHDRNLQLKNDA